MLGIIQTNAKIQYGLVSANKFIQRVKKIEILRMQTAKEIKKFSRVFFSERHALKRIWIK